MPFLSLSRWSPWPGELHLLQQPPSLPTHLPPVAAASLNQGLLIEAGHGFFPTLPMAPFSRSDRAAQGHLLPALQEETPQTQASLFLDHPVRA